MRNYPFVLERLLNTPLLAHPDKATTVAGVVLRQAGMDVNISVEGGVNEHRMGPVQETIMRRRVEMSGRKPFLFADGIAVIEVTGSLAHRQWHLGKSSGVMGYDGIGAQLDSALEDPDVQGIMLDIHSAGGEVSGAFQLGDRIFEARQQKPIIAMADEMAFSAGYVLAAAANEVWLASETAAVGSVGVVMVHFSFEQFLKAEGVKPTIIHAGAHKADGNPYEDLSEEVLASFQEKIDAVYDVFVGRVARWRGLSEGEVRRTEANVFMGRSAVDVGLAEGVIAPADAFTALAAESRASLPARRAV
ncbi:MAG: S49 family peptidase [Pseudomonadota bacterium]